MYGHMRRFHLFMWVMEMDLKTKFYTNIRHQLFKFFQRGVHNNVLVSTVVPVHPGDFCTQQYWGFSQWSVELRQLLFNIVLTAQNSFNVCYCQVFLISVVVIDEIIKFRFLLLFLVVFVAAFVIGIVVVVVVVVFVFVIVILVESLVLGQDPCGNNELGRSVVVALVVLLELGIFENLVDLGAQRKGKQRFVAVLGLGLVIVQLQAACQPQCLQW
mmetsp:Transcript_10348/g.20956  ORF Transcript_10348/g.20956 Transcript_10348/m.20956 type:complete len:215 (+) Transcript_10348:4062-4706(+)